MKTVHLVDVYNWIHRAYFACAPLTAPDGTPTGALKQFLVMANRLLMETRDDPNGSYIVFAFDPPAKTWRHRAIQQWVAEQDDDDYLDEVFPKSKDYKGNRDKSKTVGLKPQIEMAYEILKLAGFCVLRKAPYECDDIMGTLSHRFKFKYKVVLHSRDKDFTQLVDHKNVTLHMPKQANCEAKLITLDNVEEFFGVPHNRIVDMLAMAGDKVDNVPGLPGVGEGTARKLIEEWGSAKNMQKNAHKLKGKSKYVRALRGEYPMMNLDLMLELVTIDRNVPTLPKKIEECRVGPSNDAKLKKIKNRLKFNSIFHV